MVLAGWSGRRLGAPTPVDEDAAADQAQGSQRKDDGHRDFGRAVTGVGPAVSRVGRDIERLRPDVGLGEVALVVPDVEDTLMRQVASDPTTGLAEVDVRQGED